VIVSRPKGLPTTGELDARTTTYWKRRDTKGEPPTAAPPVRGPSRRPARPHPSPARQVLVGSSAAGLLRSRC